MALRTLTTCMSDLWSFLTAEASTEICATVARCDIEVAAAVQARSELALETWLNTAANFDNVLAANDVRAVICDNTIRIVNYDETPTECPPNPDNVCLTLMVANDSIDVDCPNGLASFICIGDVLRCILDPGEEGTTTCVQPTLDGSPAPCPIPFPVRYNGVNYPSGATVAEQLSFDRNCVITWDANDCLFCIPNDCDQTPPVLTTPPVVNNPSITTFDSGVYCGDGPFEFGSIQIVNANPTWTLTVDVSHSLIGVGGGGCNGTLELLNPAGGVMDIVPGIGTAAGATFLSGNLTTSGVYQVRWTGAAGCGQWCVRVTNATVTP